MIQKIITIIFLCLLITSCGKKGDPVYKQSKKENQSTKIEVVL